MDKSVIIKGLGVYGQIKDWFFGVGKFEDFLYVFLPQGNRDMINILNCLAKFSVQQIIVSAGQKNIFFLC